MKGLILAVLLFIGGTNTVSALGDAHEERMKVEQTLIQCKFEGQLTRGLLSVMQLVFGVVGEVPPKEFMIDYIRNFYNLEVPLERRGAMSAAHVLEWIYSTKPTDPHQGEKDYFNFCLEGKDVTEAAKEEYI